MDKKQRTCHQDRISASSSAGGYTWNGNDLRRALLSNNANQKRVLLRSLLTNPGTCLPRPKRRRRTQEHGNEGVENLGKPLLSQVIKCYLQDDESGKNSSSENRNTKISSTFFTENESILNNLQKDLSEITSSRSKTQLLYDHCNENDPRFLFDVKNQLAQEDKSASEIDLILYFLQAKSLIKLSYASQLYDRYIDLNNDSAKGSRNRIEMGKDQLFLDKVEALSRLNLDVLEAFLLMLVEPIRRRTNNATVTSKENIFSQEAEPSHPHYWISFILHQSIDPKTYHRNEEASDALCDAVVHFISSLNEKESYSTVKKADTTDAPVRVWKLPAPVLIMVCKLYFPIARICLGSLIEDAVILYEEIPSFVGKKAVDLTSNSNEKTRSGDNDRSKPIVEGLETLDSPSPSRDYDECIRVLKSMVSAHKCFRSLIREMLHVSDGYTHGNNASNSFSLDHVKALESIENMVFTK
jgi:hypothetical protein